MPVRLGPKAGIRLREFDAHGRSFGVARANCYDACVGVYDATGEAIPVPSFVRTDKRLESGYILAVSASEIIKELPNLSEEERRAILDKLRELAQVDDDRWEEIIKDPVPRPKLQTFIEQATAEGSEPIDLNRMSSPVSPVVFGKRTSN